MRTPILKNRNVLAAALACLALLSLAPASDAEGIRMDVIPTLRLEEGYDSNVYSAADDEVGSFGTRVAPGLALRFTAPDEVKLQFSGTYERIWYYDADARDADDHTWDLRVESSGAWKFTPSFSVRPSAYYLRTPDSYRRIQLLPTGDPTLPPVSIVNTGTAKTDEFGGGLAFEYALSPKWTIGARGSYSNKHFPSDNTAAGFSDTTHYGGGFSVLHTVSPRGKIGVTGSVSQDTYEFNDSTDSYFAGIRFAYEFTPVLLLDMSVGASMIRSTDEVTGENKEDTSPAGSFSLTYLAPATTARVYGSMVYTGNTGFGVATRQYTAGLSFTNWLSPLWSWSLNGVYQKNESVFSEDSVDIDSVAGRAKVSYRLMEWLLVEGYVTTEWQDSGGQSGDSITSQSAVLGFTVGKPVNLY